MNIPNLITTEQRPAFSQNCMRVLMLACIALLFLSGCNKAETHQLTPWFKIVHETSEFKVRDLNINRHVEGYEYFILRDKEWVRLETRSVTFVPPSVVLLDDTKIVHEKNRQPIKICEQGRLSLTPDSMAYDCTILRYDDVAVLWIYITRFDLYGKKLGEFSVSPISRRWMLLAANIWAYDEQNNPYFLFRSKDSPEQMPRARDCALFTQENEAVRIYPAGDDANGNQCEDVRYWTEITKKTLRAPPSIASSALPRHLQQSRYHFDWNFPDTD